MTYQGMNRREFLLRCGVSCATAATLGMTRTLSQAVAGSKPDAKPNIIFFLGDDPSYFDVGCYGNTVIQRPAIDQLAREIRPDPGPTAARKRT